MFFALFSKVFTNVLKDYELPKIYNEILKKIVHNNHHNFILLLNFIKNVHLGAMDSFGTKLKKILRRIIFLKM